MTNGSDEIVSEVSPKARDLAKRARALIQSVYPAVVEVPWPEQRVIGYRVGPKKMSEHFCYLSVSRIMGILLTMDAEQGMEAMSIINPRQLIPIHHTGYEVFKSPLDEFRSRVAAAGLEDRVTYLSHGERYEFETPGSSG